ncbi:MAG: DUF86 domain-containing protein [Thermomicrobiales bacterium]
MHQRTAQSLLDIVDACNEIDAILDGISLEEYRGTRVLQLSTERLFITIAEALKRVDENDPDVASTVTDRRNIIGMRNRIVHGYDTIELETVWTAAVRHAPILRQEVLAILGSHPDEP